MRSLVLALALAALLAPATPASIPQAEPFEKKLADAVKEVLETDAQIQKADDVEQPNTVKDVDNQLLKKAPEDIPVKVVVEDVQPTLKVNEEKKDDEKNDAVYNEVDLEHPGEPQRQEHETQNPETHEDQPSGLAALKQMIADTQVVFNNGFRDVSEHIAEWLTDNKPEISIKDSIDNLQESFMENIDKLNATIQTYWNHGADVEKQEDIKKVQSGLKVLEEKFENGVQNLNNGVRTLAVLKTGRQDTTTTTTAKPSGNPFGFVTGVWQTVTNQFGNITNQLQNIIGQNNNTSQVGTGSQSDDPSGTTDKPGVWQNIQNQFAGFFQNRPQGAQSDEQPSPTGPFAQVIQNVPLLQNFVNFIQPKPQSAEPSKPAEPAQPAPSEGSNAVPAESQAPSDQQQKKPDEQAQPAQPNRPIQQIIQKNPIVQSITGAVQKIQHSITNPEKPREEEVVKNTVEKDAAKKGYPFYGYGHHGHRPGNGDNNDSGVGLEKSAPVEAQSAVEAEKKTPVEAQSAVEAEKIAPVEAVKSAPVEAVKSVPVEAVKSVPVEAQSAPVEIEKIAPVEPVKSVVVEAEKTAVVEAVKSAPVEAENTPVEAEIPAPAPAPVSQEAVKQD